MTEQRVSSRYARALLTAAKEENATEKVLEDLGFIQRVARESKDFKRLIESPVIYNWQKKDILRELFESQISEVTLKFLLLLADKKREMLIFDIIEQYIKIFNELNNRLPISVVSAVPLSEELKKSISGRIAQWTGKTIIPEYSVDDSLKGGIMVEIDDIVFDASVRNQLEVLYETLAKN
jgi:F-type H+-transporting ATPase subunit delta